MRQLSFCSSAIVRASCQVIRSIHIIPRHVFAVNAGQHKPALEYAVRCRAQGAVWADRLNIDILPAGKYTIYRRTLRLFALGVNHRDGALLCSGHCVPRRASSSFIQCIRLQEPFPIRYSLNGNVIVTYLFFKYDRGSSFSVWHFRGIYEVRG